MTTKAITKSYVPTKYNFDSELKFTDTLIEDSLALNEKQRELFSLKDELKVVTKSLKNKDVENIDDLQSRSVELNSKIDELSLYIKEKETELLGTLQKEYEEHKLTIKGIIAKELEELKVNKATQLTEIDEKRKAGIAEIDNDVAKYSDEELAKKEIKNDISNRISGVNIVAKRAQLKAKNDYAYDVKQTKLKRYFLHRDYVAIKNTITAKEAGFVDQMVSVFYENWVTVDIKEIVTNKKTYINMLPLVLLVLMASAFYISRPFTGYTGGFDVIMNKGVFVATVAVGAVFIYSGGSFDMSLGPASVMCATVCGLTWNVTHNVFLSLLVSIILGAVLGIVNAILASVLDLPVMVMTLTMMNILNAIHSVIMSANGNDIDYGPNGTGLPNQTWVFATFLVGFFILCWVIFNYTKMGRRNKLIGSNSRAAKFSGVNLMTAGIISFAISGIGLGIAGFLFASYKQTGIPLKMEISSIGLNVVIAIVLGGMTTSGGPRSRISCGLIGALFVTFLDQFFVSLSTIPALQPVLDYTNLAKGVVFLIVSFINMYSSRPKMLAR